MENSIANTSEYSNIPCACAAAALKLMSSIELVQNTSQSQKKIACLLIDVPSELVVDMAPVR